MWWIIIIAAILILIKVLDYKSNQAIKRKAAQEYLDEHRSSIASDDENEDEE